MSIAEWDALTESHRELERYSREAMVLLDLPPCARCQLRPAVIRVTHQLQYCGGCATHTVGDWWMADTFDRIVGGR